MAELFLARTVGPEGFEKLVVLKKILPNFAENQKFVRLFLDEARLAATLDHPHIAHVYDMGKVDASYFFTMEFVHGQDLRATVKRTARLERRLPIDHAVQIGHAVASALHYAHERRKPDGSSLEIVHRDVSPSNILIAYDGAIKLVDFGVAKAATSSVKTRTGTLKGKIAYMSPEQAKGSPIDRRSDVFSLGIVLWELVTSQRLFKADNDLAAIQLIINSKPQPPTELRPDCPPELERIILKALAANAADRYQSAEDMQLDLEELVREHKLKQSTIALRAHMHELFAEEIAAWKAAQASGVTLTDHVLAAGVADMTTPASDGEVSFADDDPDDNDQDDNEPELAPAYGVLHAAPRAPTGTPVAIPSVVVAPPRPPTGPNVAAGASQPRMGTMPPQTFPGENSFPIAPREWRSGGPAAVAKPDHSRRTKQYIIGGLVGVAVLAVLALVLGGSYTPPRPPAPIAPPKDEVIEMKAQPAPTPKAPAATPPTPAPAPAPVDTMTPAPHG
jgi:serine/threonine protein kinase